MFNIIKDLDYQEGRFSKEEEKALLAFAEFAKHLPGIYTRNTATPYGTFFDVASTNRTGGTELVELKYRNGADIYGDCFIEPEKWSNLMHAWRVFNNMPIYINLIDGWKNVYVWYLPGISTDPILHKDVKIKTYDGCYMIVDRLGLAWDNAYHYVWNEVTQAYDVTKPSKQKPIKEKAIHYLKNNNPKTNRFFNE